MALIPEESMPVAARRALTTVFVIVSFVGSGLLFLVQPMVARFVLPIAGGSAALWNTAMLFFQVVLLGGYVFAHMSIRRVGLRWHPAVQLVVVALPLLVLPVAVPAGWQISPDDSTALWVLTLLAVMVGLPFFALATASPTLQRWFSSTRHPQAADPYFLYSAGNVGSVVALLAYPFVLEPWLTLHGQAVFWAGGYVVFLIGCVACALLIRRYGASAPLVRQSEAADPIATKRRGRWLLLAFLPSALMLGVTQHIATDLASFPLLWIIPLVLYLLTFVIAFGRPAPWVVTVARWAVIVGALPVAITVIDPPPTVTAVLALHLAWFFVAALLGHSLLAGDRPEASRLTEFYIVLSVGGALGGVFAALVAPLAFDVVLEYPLAIALMVIVASLGVGQSGVLVRYRVVLVTIAALAGVLAIIFPSLLWMMGGIAAILVALGLGSAAGIAALVTVIGVGSLVTVPDGTDFQGRSFFGVYAVFESDGFRALRSGTTLHGTQSLDPTQASHPTTYFSESGPLGQVMGAMNDRSHVGVVGLGAGTIAAYGREGDDYVFYEIDPLVGELAADERLFTYLSSSPADIDVVVTDGRRGLDETEDRFDLIVIDAFSSDAIPIHLMTSEAVELALDRLRPGGVVLLHVSNNYFDLAPVLGSIADDLGVEARVQLHEPTEAEIAAGARASKWVLVAPDAETIDEITAGDPWTTIDEAGPLWTDDYSNILGVIDR